MKDGDLPPTAYRLPPTERPRRGHRRKVDELHALVTSDLLDAEPASSGKCYDCTSYIVVVRAGRTTHSFSGWMTDDATHVVKTLRALGVW